MLAKKLLLSILLILYVFSLKVFYLILIQPINIVSFDKSRKCNATVILGGINDYDRILKGLELAKLNTNAIVIFSGINDKYKSVINAFEFKNIIFDNYSFNTFQNAKYSKDILNENNISNICLITSNEHLYRAKRVFEKQGLNIIPIVSNRVSLDLTISSYLPSLKYLQLNVNILYEYLALIKYKLLERV
ncbi:MAG TPA: YdcF family protein [Arcobacter sp.]|nr:YdcF family protein [Arcobacter sp.]